MAALICRPSADALSTDEFDLYCELFKLCWRGDFPWRIDSYFCGYGRLLGCLMSFLLDSAFFAMVQ
jgi:hypothetical protein